MFSGFGSAHVPLYGSRSAGNSPVSHRHVPSSTTADGVDGLIGQMGDLKIQAPARVWNGHKVSIFYDTSGNVQLRVDGKPFEGAVLIKGIPEQLSDPTPDRIRHMHAYLGNENAARWIIAGSSGYIQVTVQSRRNSWGPGLDLG